MAMDLNAQPKHELFVEQQLERVTKRLHALDVGRTGLLLLAVVLAHALIMSVIDLSAGPKAAGWVTMLRVGVWVLSLLGSLGLGGLLMFQVFSKINPYYAAREIEETIPDAKNSVVNWLDLKKENLPPVVKNALGLRAAHDLKTTDPEETIHPPKNTWLLAVVIGGLVLGLLVLLAKEPGRFTALMQRAFLPLGKSALATRTGITLMQPAKGDLTISPQQNVSFQVRISGVVPRQNSPEAARLLFRYEAEEPWVVQPLEFEEIDGIWTTRLVPDQIQNGLTYKVQAGDAETAEYQIIVQTIPEVSRFEISYHFPPYTHIKDRTVVFPNPDDGVFPRIKGPRGTEVTMAVRTNRVLHSGNVELSSPDSAREIAGDLLDDDAKAFRVKFTLEQTGQMRVNFTTKAGDENSDIAPYNVHVIPDTAPVAELRVPGKDVELPANGTLLLEGYISDDFGIKQVLLRLEVAPGGRDRKTLAARVYRPEKSFRFADGSYADRLEYRDFVILDGVQDLKGDTVELAKGDVLSYWLEATDNCDYPIGQANVGRSKAYKVTIVDPADARKQRDEQRQAEQEQKAHEKRQDQDLKQQEIDRKRKQQEQDNQPGNDNGQAAEQQKRNAEEQKKDNDRLKRLNEQIENEKKDLTKKNVDELKDLAKESGPVGDLAKRELKDAAGNAKDDNVRQAAQDALKNDGAQPTPQDIEKLKEMLKDKGPLGEAARKELAKAMKQAQDPKTRQAADEALKNVPEQKDPGQKDLSEKDLAELKKMLEKEGLLKDLAKNELKKAAEQSKNEDLKKAAQDALKNAEPQPTPRDIDKLKDMLNDKGRLGEAAKKELEKVARQAQDPKTRQAADEALKNAQAQEPPPQKEVTAQDIERMKEILKDKGPLGEFARQQLKDAAERAKDPALRKAAQDAAKNQKEPSARDMDEVKNLLKDDGPLGDLARKEMERIARESKDPGTRKAAEDAMKNAPKGSTKPEAKKDLTEKDIAQLSDLAKKQGPLADAARQQLKDAAQNAKDPAVQKAAQGALKDVQEHQKAEKNQQPSPKDIAQLKDLAKDKGALGDAAAQKLTKMAQDAKDDSTRQAARDALKEAGRDDSAKDVTSKEIAQLKNMGGKQGLLGDLAKRELAEAARLAKDPAVRKAAQEALKELSSQKFQEPNLDDVDLLKTMAKEKGALGDAARRELARLSTEAKDGGVREAARSALKETPPRALSRKDPIKDADLKDVDEQKEMLNKEGLLGDLAAQRLAETARLAKDAAVRKAAEDALKSRGKGKTEDLTPRDVDKLKPLLEDTGPLGEAVTREMARLSLEARNAEVRAAADKALKESPRLQDKLAANRPPATDANRRSGVLNLEEISKLVTPEILKKAGISAEEWNQMKQRAQQAKDDSQTQRGDPGVLPGNGPRLTVPGPSDGSSTQQGNRGQPPPGFRDAFNRWTTRRPDEK